jgi:hypothetical protein
MADPAAAGQLIEACGRLPLALAIATALIATRPRQTVTTVVTSLRNAASPLDILTAGAATADLRAVFGRSYQALSPPSAGMFRLLAGHPGPDISAASAAALTGLPSARVAEALAELADLHLLDEHVPGRFAFPNLLRLYAAELLGTVDRPEERHPGERRAAGWRMRDYRAHTTRAAAG